MQNEDFQTIRGWYHTPGIVHTVHGQGMNATNEFVAYVLHGTYGGYGPCLGLDVYGELSSGESIDVVAIRAEVDRLDKLV